MLQLVELVGDSSFSVSSIRVFIALIALMNLVLITFEGNSLHLGQVSSAT